MKIAIYFIRGAYKLVIGGACILSVVAWADEGYIYDYKGDLSISAGNNAAHKAVQSDVVGSDTYISTGDKSYAILKFEDGQVATMQANTTFHIDKYHYDSNLAGKNNMFFSKFKGGMRFITGRIAQRNNLAFLLATPNATINIRSAELVVATFKDSLYGQVKSGSISMTNKAGITTFKAGQTILVKTARTLPRVIPAASLPQGIFSQLDAIPIPPTTPPPQPETSATASENPAIGTAAGIILDSAPNNIATTGTSAAMLPAGISTTAASADSPSAALPPPSDNAPTSPDTLPSAGTISITGAGASYTGADLLCDFCTGRSNTVATHVEPKTTADGSITGDANLFRKHNLTPTGANTGEICAFCHAPQGAEDKVSPPRWNRALTTLSSYRAYASLGSATQQATGSISMACLSCHDGSQAPNIVINTPDLRLDVGDTMVTGANDLKNHHPVGIQYAGGGQNQNAPDITLNPIAAYDRLVDMNGFAMGNKFSSIYLNFRPNKLLNSSDASAMNDVLTFSNEGNFDSTKGGFNKSTYSGTGSGTVWWIKSPGSKKGRQKTDLYLFTRTDMLEDTSPEESTLNRPYIECATCHDPHSTNPTFLRMPGGNERSQICLACHNK